jgi:hypothetical protein
VVLAAWWFGAARLLGPHSTWIFQHAGELIQQRMPGFVRAAGRPDTVGFRGKVKSK